MSNIGTCCNCACNNAGDEWEAIVTNKDGIRIFIHTAYSGIDGPVRLCNDCNLLLLQDLASAHAAKKPNPWKPTVKAERQIEI